MTNTNFKKIFKRLFKDFDKLIPGHTYIFELMSKENPIVTRYEEEFVVLIGVRDLISLQEFTQETLDLVAADLGVKRPKRFNATNIDDCRALFEQMSEDEEGLVVVDKDFNRFKLKQESYLKMARIMSLKDQDILDYVLGKSEIDADFDKMPEVKERIEVLESMYRKFVEIVGKTYDPIKDIETQKDFALKAIKFPFSGILFKMRKGIKFEDIDLKYKQLEIWYKPKEWFKDE